MLFGSCTFRCPRLENLWRRCMLNFAWSTAATVKLEYDCCSVERFRLGKWGSSRDWPGNKCWYYGVIQWASLAYCQILSDIVHCVRVTRGLWSLENVDIIGGKLYRTQFRFGVDLLCYVVLSKPFCYFPVFTCTAARKDSFLQTLLPSTLKY